MAKLSIGDKVMWRGSFGNDEAKEATITGIEVCNAGEKYGRSVSSVDWDDVDKIVADLDNGHWARGKQLSPIKK